MVESLHYTWTHSLSYQRVLRSCARRSISLITLPASLSGAAAKKVVLSLLRMKNLKRKLVFLTSVPMKIQKVPIMNPTKFNVGTLDLASI
jgi:hypothetical protein